MLHVNFGVIWISKSHATPLADETSIICFNLRFDNEICVTVSFRLGKICVTASFRLGKMRVTPIFGELDVSKNMRDGQFPPW